jgi:uncharacterized protein (DUF2236 family)
MSEALPAHGKGRPIDSDELERQLAHVRRSAAGDIAGVFGPGSMIWQIDREAAVFLGAGRALLLQLAHPWVAAGVAEHSTTLSDPIGRFHRTFEIMFTLVFGSLDQALAAARRLHRRHAAVRGDLAAAQVPSARGTYSANEAAALQWVHATLVETALIAHDVVLPPLSGADRERYYQESRLLGAMFGLGPEVQPASWTAFAAYNEAMRGSDVLCVGPTARNIATQVLGGAGGWLRAPRWYRAVTAHLLPPSVRDGFELPYGPHERRTAERALRGLRRIYPALPGKLRQVGPYQEAMERLRGRSPPGAAVRLLNRAWIGRPTLPGPRAEG